jgi:hypothetical protein
MANAMKVHLYQVLPFDNSPDLVIVLDSVVQTPLASRLRMVGQQEIRLEEVLPPKLAGNPTPYWLLDFTRLRFEHGPGRANRSEPIEGFDLQNDDGFGEETAALYDPAARYMLVQYNHFGVRAGAIQDYLSFFDKASSQSYELRVKLDGTAEQRLAQKQILKKIVFKVAPAHMTQTQRNAGVSLERAIELSDNLQGQSIEISISAGRSANAALSFNRIGNLIAALRKLVAADQNALDGVSQGPKIVEKFEVHGKSGVGEVTDAIDMLASKLELSIDGLVLGGDLRYTRRSRWNGLIRARNGWNNLL